jgi:uncharacterized protein YndB with AHSA1/START domain
MTTMKSRRARAVADVSEGTILATVDIAAPPERVFRSLTSAEVTKWWGADAVYRMTEWTGDVRVGGQWQARGVGADGSAFGVGGEFVEIEAPTKVSYTWKSEGAPGEVTTVRYRLDAIEGGTRATLRHSGFQSAESCASHSEGWGRVLGWLQAYAQPTDVKALSYFFLRLVPPRPTFAMDMNDVERSAMMGHVAYWRKLLEDGVAVAFAPVGDPKGPWGAGLVELEAPESVKTIEANDPAILAAIGLHYEVLPMMRAVVRPA